MVRGFEMGLQEVPEIEASGLPVLSLYFSCGRQSRAL